MNTKRFLILSCFLFLMFSSPLLLAGSHGSLASPQASMGHASSISSRPAITRSLPTVNRTATFHRSDNVSRSFNNFNRNTATLNQLNGNFRRRRFHDRVIFVNSFGFGFPFYSSFYGFPYYYDYYPYAYGYPPYGGYYGGGYYGGGYYGDGAYNGYSTYYGNPRYGRGLAADDSTVAQVQRRLAREGYYKGGVDGEMGPRTHYAIRAYQREHNLRVTGTISEQLLADLGVR